MIRFVTFTMAGVAAFGVAACAHAQQKPKNPSPTVDCPIIAKGDSYVIHAVPYYGAATLLKSPVMITNYTIVHLNRKTFKMQSVFTPQSSTHQFIGGINRTIVDSTRLGGVLTDKQRLYVLVRTDRSVTMQGFRAPPQTSRSEKLLVFWLADGKRIFAQNLATPNNAAGVGLLTIGKLKPGPLRLVKDGVACYGKVITFDGKKGALRAPKKWVPTGSFFTPFGNGKSKMCLHGDDWALTFSVPHKKLRFQRGVIVPTDCRYYKGPKITRFIRPPAGPPTPPFPKAKRYSTAKVNGLSINIVAQNSAPEPKGFIEITVSEFTVGDVSFAKSGRVRLPHRGPYP